MKSHSLKSLRTLDQESFQAVIRALGFTSAALYRAEHDNLLQIVSTGESDLWPVSVPLSPYYTTTHGDNAPFGFTKISMNAKCENHWGKSTVLYFPEQEFAEIRLVFALAPAPGKRIRSEELHSGLEVIASRVRSLLQKSFKHRFASEESFKEHIKALGVDLRAMIEHELRTPLASVTGYIALLADLPEKEQYQAFQDFQPIIHEQAGIALDALEKLSLTLQTGDDYSESAQVESFDASEEVVTLCRSVNDRAHEYLSASAAKKIEIVVQQALDQKIMVHADRKLFGWSLCEVLKNAITHARHGRVEVSVYHTDGMLVLDVADDGMGLSLGSEELVFLRFYQDPSTAASRKGKKGLGLGLFLSRHIVERHMGKLMFIRKQNRTGFFRFLWPAVKEESALKKEA